ncbi:hypothetical protein T459_07470 [Capsicum annuum]|uniref:Uncharacterized protein n=1 Tax=Capsicum annuum TaxID=4072 RepID=A0A2G2ZTR2_CAPAN|nr:hypothetical protein T459_07470 [Capsicum annuum]
MKESKMMEVFIQVQDETYSQHLLPTLGKSFIEVFKMEEMIEDGIKTSRIVSFAILKATTQAIQKCLGSVGGKKYEEDASAIVVGQQAWGHSIEDCRSLKREIEKMIQYNSNMVQTIDSAESSSHADIQTNG